jgi:hypothetical protein
MKFYLLIAGITSILLSSCATFHISTNSLIEQLANTAEQKKMTLFISYPIIIPFAVTGNSITELKCLDKNEKEIVLNVTNRTGIRITKKDSSKTTFYFNTLLIKDSLITGKKDHFLGVNIKPINLNNILKIELQR